MDPLADALLTCQEQQFEVEGLGLLDVEITPEQAELFGSVFAGGQSRYAVTPLFLPDPLATTDYSVEGRRTYLQTVDGVTDLATTVIGLQVVETDWAAAEYLDLHGDPDWRRFPSLPCVRRMLAGGDVHREDVAAIRAWDLWPVDEHMASLVEGTMREWLEAYYEPLVNWARCNAGDEAIPCQFVGTPIGTHEHPMHEDGPYDPCPPHLPDEPCYECVEGEHWYDEVYAERTAYYGGLVYALDFPEYDPPSALIETFDRLLGISEANASRCLQAWPVHERPRVVLDERSYNPWLSLS